MERIKSFFLTIEHSISLLRSHKDGHSQQLNQKIFSLTTQSAYSLCIVMYVLLSATQQCHFYGFFMNWRHCPA